MRSKFFFPSKIEAKKFEIQLFQKISDTIILFDSKYEFRIISAFIWFAYCPCKWEIIIFQKLAGQKLENLSVKLGDFDVTLRKNYGSYEVAQSFYRCTKIPSFIWDHVWTDLGRNLGLRISKSLLATQKGCVRYSVGADFADMQLSSSLALHGCTLPLLKYQISFCNLSLDTFKARCVILSWPYFTS